MSSDLPKPRFVVFEGGDGSGKTSIRRLLFKELATRGRMPLSLSGVTWTSAEATAVITKAKYLGAQYPDSKILDALVTDRRLLHTRFISRMRPERDVFSDRYILSDVVYNNLHYGIPHAESIAAFRAANMPEPDLLVFLETPPDIAVARLKARRRPIHTWETLQKQRRVAKGFRELLSANPLGWKCPVIKLINTDALETVGQRITKQFFDQTMP